jgi:uncharacterized protein YjbI with pentapeptide repeats
LNGAALCAADCTNANFDRADLRGADLSGLKNWRQAAGYRLANIHNVQNAPDGFLAWARSAGAVDLESDDAWNAAISGAEAEHVPAAPPASRP